MTIQHAIDARERATFDEFQDAQVELIATHYPFSKQEVMTVYLRCGKDFNATVHALEQSLAEHKSPVFFDPAA